MCRANEFAEEDFRRDERQTTPGQCSAERQSGDVVPVTRSDSTEAGDAGDPEPML
jgi:hypothetical protein